MTEQDDQSILYIALAQAPSPLPFSSQKFSSWKKVVVLSYQGFDNVNNLLIVFFGRECDKKRLKSQMITWATENRNSVRQVYHVYARARTWLQHLLDSGFLATHAKRKEKSPFVFCSTFYGSSDGETLCNRYPTHDDQALSNFETYDEDMLAFFPSLKKLLLNTRRANMAPLLDHSFNPFAYFYPLTCLNPMNQNVDYDKLMLRVCTHLNNSSLYTIFVEAPGNKCINTMRFAENLSVLLEQHFGVKYGIEIMSFQEQNMYTYTVYLSNATQYHLFLLCVQLSLKQLMGTKAFRIMDMTGFHDLSAIQEGWNMMCDIILAKNPQEKMTTLMYDNEVTCVKQKSIVKKKLDIARQLQIFHQVPLDIYDLHHEALARTEKKSVGKKKQISLQDNEEIDATEKLRQEKEHIMNFLPHGAQKRFSNSNPKEEKEVEWHNMVRTLPFGKYHTNGLQNKKRKRTIHGVDEILKKENVNNTSLMELSSDIYISHIFNPKSPKKAVLLTGPPGNGKTHYAMHVLPKILDERPVCFVSVAGVQDPHVLLGHDFTYVGAKPGKIIQEIIDAKCLDPIMIFDEIDKAGSKIQNMLISLLDPLQNNAFKDAFLGNIPLDLSRSFFVMTCNAHNTEYISSPLLDRLRMVKVPSLSYEAQIGILQNVIVPKVVSNIFEHKDDEDDDQDILSTIRHQICDREIAKEILTLAHEQNVDEESSSQDALSLRCIEKTVHKVVLEFIKTVLSAIQQTRCNAESEEEADDSKNTGGDDVKGNVMWHIFQQKCKMDRSHVNSSRKSFDASSSKKSVFLSYLYT